MTMQIQATGLVGTKKSQVNVDGVLHTVYRIRHLGLTNNYVWLNTYVQADTALDLRMESLRAAAELGKEKDQYIRVLARGGNATLNIQTEVLPNGKADRRSGTLSEGAVCKANGIDFFLSNIRQIPLDQKLEPEEFSATVLGQITRGGGKTWTDAELKSIDLLMPPLQAGQDEGFHLRVIAEKGTPAKEVLQHPDSPNGFYWVSGSLVRNEGEGQDEKSNPISPWDRIALHADTVFVVSTQLDWKQKQTNQAVAMAANEAAGPDPMAYLNQDENAVSAGISFEGGLDDD